MCAAQVLSIFLLLGIVGWFSFGGSESGAANLQQEVQSERSLQLDAAVAREVRSQLISEIQLMKQNKGSDGCVSLTRLSSSHLPPHLVPCMHAAVRRQVHVASCADPPREPA